MKKTTMFGIVALLLVGLVASAFAFQAKGVSNDAVREAIEANDYDAWKNAVSAELTEERFDQLVERHKQMQERRAEMEEGMQQREQKRAEMEEAMQQGYDAWKEAVADCPGENRLTEVINEGNFDTFVEMHEARQNGDFETANALAEELGLQNQRKGLGRAGFKGREFQQE